jgi:FkbM family methyltransferase
MTWLNILANMRGIYLKTEVGLFLSSLLDLIFTLTGSSTAALPKTYISGIVYLKPYKVHFNVRAFTDDLYAVLPGREEDVNELILSSLHKGDVFLDIGANIGYYSVLAARIVGTEGEVISVEPTPATAVVLNANLKLNGLKNVTVIQKAAWNRSGYLSYYIPKGFFGWASIQKPAGNAQKLEVETFCLDDLPSIRKVNFIKIDAEGAEYQILQGATKTLDKAQFVVLEVSENETEMTRLLIKKGFSVRKMKFSTYFVAKKRNPA